MLNRPNRYIKDALKDDFEKIKARRDRILESLVRMDSDRYSNKAIQQAKREKVRFLTDKIQPDSQPRHLISYAHQQLASTKPGLRIYLAADQELQRAAEHAVNAELDHFDRGPHGFYNQLSYRY